jgi:hypothetical protein
VRLAGPYGDLITVAVGTGLRYGEVTALWVRDVDLTRRTLRVSKAWKREGEAGAHDIPSWLSKSLTPKLAMREHYLGNPKTAKSRRTISISPAVAAALARQMAGKAPEEIVFTTRHGRPLHNGDFHTHVWRKLMKALAADSVAPPLGCGNGQLEWEVEPPLAEALVVVVALVFGSSEAWVPSPVSPHAVMIRTTDDSTTNVRFWMTAPRIR